MFKLLELNIHPEIVSERLIHCTSESLRNMTILNIIS